MADEYDSSRSEASETVSWARRKMQEHLDATGDWRSDATAAYGCVAGDQWDDSDRSKLDEEGRPVFTFNRVAGFIRGICGLETSTRNEVRFYARENGDTGLNDVINAAAKWVRSNCDAEDEESDAFKDMLTCGIGWTETLFTTEEDPEGQIIIERVDPLHMRWDPAARKRGLADSRWRARVKWLPIGTIEDVWGLDKAREIETMVETDSEVLEEFAGQPHDATAAHEYDSDSLGQARRKNGYPVVQFQYVRTATYYSVINPLSGMPEELTEADFNKLNDRIGGALEGSKYKRRQYRQLIYCGVTELEDGVLPGDSFTFNCITGIRDRNNGVWYGFVRDMLDPQRWINKFFSSMADVVASQAKGGLLAEADAFVNKQNAEDDWADPRSIVWLKNGALAGGKIKERQSSGIPAGFSQLLEFTVGSLPHVAGVNLEFLGLAGREQAGVLENQRKQAAIATLAEFFNALRLYRKQQGRVLLQFIQEFISDGRLIRVVGKRDAQYVPLIRQPGTLKYDIVVDEAPNSPDQKNRTWEALMQIIPTAAKMGFPIPPSIVEYAPFPQALVTEWQEFAQGEAGLPPEMKEKMQQMQEQLQAVTKENEQLKSKKDEKMIELQLKQQGDQQDLQLEQQRLQMQMQMEQQRIQLERERAQAQMEIEQFKAQAHIQLEREKADAKLQLDQQQTQAKLQMDQQQSEAKMKIEREQAFREDAANALNAEEGKGGKSQNAPRVGALAEALTSAQAETREAIKALAQVMAEMAKAQRAPRTISDGKGRSYTVKSGD